MANKVHQEKLDMQAHYRYFGLLVILGKIFGPTVLVDYLKLYFFKSLTNAFDYAAFEISGSFHRGPNSLHYYNFRTPTTTFLRCWCCHLLGSCVKVCQSCSCVFWIFLLSMIHSLVYPHHSYCQLQCHVHKISIHQ